MIDAGCDQFGGESCPELICELVRSGRLAEERVDTSVRRLLAVKFDLGLFDDPYVDEKQAGRTVGRPDFVAAGKDAQRRSLTLLKNSRDEDRPTLPLPGGTRVYAPDLSPEALGEYSILVSRPADADVAVLRLRAPYDHRGTYFLEEHFHAGSLEFDQATLDRVADLARTVPVVIDLYLDRPAILASLDQDAAAILVNYGCSETALLEVVFGEAAPQGRLPFELPRSMAAVESSRPDLPSDTPDPLYPYRFGLSFPAAELAAATASAPTMLGGQE